jgi:carbon storage regulator
MLIQSRREGESLTIGDNILVKVLGVHGKEVKIGIEAPKSIRVGRESRPEKELKKQ